MSGAGTVHASAVAVGERGVLVRGASGSGKSSLVLGIIDRDPDTSFLVADDRVTLMAHDGRVEAAVPETIAGRLEVRGLGIVTVPYVSPCPVALVVDLLPADRCPRFPEPRERTTVLLGIALPRLLLPIGAVDAPARVRFALRHFPQDEVA